jgi:hypothetical protein
MQRHHMDLSEGTSSSGALWGRYLYVDRAFLLPTRPAVWGSGEQQANTMESFFQGHKGLLCFVFHLGCTYMHIFFGCASYLSCIFTAEH